MLSGLVCMLQYRIDLMAFAMLGAAGGLWLRHRLLRQGMAAGAARFAAWSLVLLVAAAVGLAELAGRREQDRLHLHLASAAPTLANAMQNRGHARLSLACGADDRLYLELIACQKQWLAEDPTIADVYTVIRDGGRFHLLVDAETDYDRDGECRGAREQRTPIGEQIDDPAGDLARAADGEVVCAGAFRSDRCGQWMSAFAPIRGTDGGVQAVLGVDIAADRWWAAIAAQRGLVLLVCGAMLAVALWLAAALGGAHARRARQRQDHERLDEQCRRLQDANAALREQSDRVGEASLLTAAAMQVKSQFLTNVGHELRTPLTAILGFSELLRDPALPEPDRLQCVDSIRSSGQRLLGLFNDVLEMSKGELDDGAVQFAPCAVDELVRAIMSLVRVRAAEKRLAVDLHLVWPAGLQAQVDRMRLRQILISLLDNAIKFTERGRIRVALVADTDAGRLVLEIEDTGIGIAGDVLGVLFAERDQGGTGLWPARGPGLGLLLVRRNVALLGGELAVQSEPDRGTRFVIEFPLRPVATVTPEAVPMPRTDDQQPLRARILLAEDGRDNQRLLAMILGRAGATVQVAQNGRQAVQRVCDAGQPPVDLVIMDMMMPEMDGYEAMRRLRDLGFRIPIVALTSNGAPGERERCLAAGSTECAEKPVRRAAFVQLLRGLLSAR